MRSRAEPALSGVIDPRIGLIIVDLGLLFEIGEILSTVSILGFFAALQAGS